MIGKDSVICEKDFIKVKQLSSIGFARSPPNLNKAGYNLEYTPKLITRSGKCQGIMENQTISFKCGDN